jgi:hypothetical protein
MHSDTARKRALDELLSALSILGNAVVTFTQACEDPRLFAPAQGDVAEDSVDSISVLSLATKVESLVASEIKTIEMYFKTGIARLYRIPNSSPKFVPIHILPTELLSGVFLEGQKGRDLHSIRVPSTYYEDTISQVCTLWRTVSINTANLWTFIDCRPPRASARVDRLLQRSGIAELSVHLRATKARPQEHDQQYLTSLVPQVHRWSHLFVSPRHDHVRDDLRYLASWFQYSPSQKTLRNLCISAVDADGRNGLDKFLAICLEKFPSLTNCHFDDLVMSSRFQCDPALFLNLTSVRFEGVTISEADLRWFLARCHDSNW